MPELNADLLRDAALKGLLPSVLALILAFAAGRIWRTGLKRMYLPANLAFAGSFFACYAFLEFAVWRPREPDYEWLPYLALSAGLAATAIRVTNLPYLRWGAAIIVPAIVAWLAVPTFLKPPSALWSWRLGMWLAVALVWFPLQLPAEQIGGPRFTFVLAALAMAAGAVLFLSGSAKFALLAFLSAAVVGGVFFAECIDRNPPLIPGLVPMFAVLHAGLLVSAMIRSGDTAKTPFILLVLAPLTLGVGWVPWFRRRRWIGMLVPAGIAALLAVIAIGLAWRDQASW